MSAPVVVHGDCVEGDVRAWREVGGLHADECKRGEWAHVDGHPQIGIHREDDGRYSLFWLCN